MSLGSYSRTVVDDSTLRHGLHAQNCIVFLWTVRLWTPGKQWLQNMRLFFIYSMAYRGTDYKFSLSLYVRLSVCLSGESALSFSRSHYLINFRQNWHRGNNEFVGGSTSLLPLFCPKTCELGLKTPHVRHLEKWKIAIIISAKVWPIATKFGTVTQFGPRDRTDR